MKKYSIILFTITATILLFSSSGYCQEPNNFICGWTKETPSMLRKNATLSKISTNVPGYYFRTTDTMKILIIYAQFADDYDTTGNQFWPLNQLPSFPIIDSVAGNNYTPYTLSHFFSQMSNGTLHVIGKTFPFLIKTEEVSSYYIGSEYGSLNFDVLRIMDSLDYTNNLVNLKEFDKWHMSNLPSGLINEKGPNKFIDMAVIIYRRIPNYLKTSDSFEWIGKADLGYNYGFDSLLTHDSIIICGNMPLRDNCPREQGAGITYKYTGEHPEILCVRLAHEFSHYLFEGHCDGYGLMGSNAIQFGGGETHGYFQSSMSSIEREKLGYMSIEPVSFGTEFSLNDYLTTNTAFKVPTDASGKEYFLLENHQKLSIYDGVGNYDNHRHDNNGKGMYIFHRYQHNSWSWEKIYPECADGDEPSEDNKDAWNIGYNQLFSPYSRPDTRLMSDNNSLEKLLFS